MKLTQATDYAFRIVLYLAKHKDQIVEADVIADVEKIPKRFLLKICRELTIAEIIGSTSGRNGGYRLAKDPEKITMKDVIEAVEGEIVLNKCQVNPEACNKGASEYCAIHHALFSIRNILAGEFEKYNFATFAEQDRNR